MKWTDDETQVLLRLYAQGATNQQIAEGVKRTISSVAWRIETLRGNGRISIVRPRFGGTDWTVREEDKLRKLWEGGATSYVCATELSRPRSSIMSKIRRMGMLRGQKTFKPVGRYPKFCSKTSIRKRYDNGTSSTDIANLLKMKTQAVRDILTEMGCDPHRNDTVSYRVHPCWSMNDNDKRQYFYEKFQAGWTEVLQRLDAK